MNVNLTPGTFRRAVYPTLVLSLPGLMAICCAILGLRNALHIAASYQVQIAVGYAVMVLVIETLGMSHRCQLLGYGMGGVFGVFLFLTGVLGGSISSMLLYEDFNSRYVLGPLFWMGFYGVLPAAAFGLIGTSILRRISDATPTIRPL